MGSEARGLVDCAWFHTAYSWDWSGVTQDLLPSLGSWRLVRKGVFFVLTECLKFIIQPHFTHLIYWFGVLWNWEYLSFYLFQSQPLLF